MAGSARRVPQFPERPGIAVLPFASLDPDEAYVAEGLAGDLVTDLARVSGLFVVGRNAIPADAGTDGDLRDTARRLGVRYVVEGDVRHAADRLRINVQLVDTATGEHLWAERFERDAADILAVQDEVRQRIVEALSIQLSPAEAQRLERLPTTNLEAYDDYLRAGHAARTGFRPKLGEALQLYARAATLDPTFAEALAADARLSVDIMRNNYDDILPAPVARQRAYERAGRALQIDPEAALPFAVLAVLQVVDGRHDDAIASAERAVALAPGDAEAHAALGLVLTFSGRHADAVAAVEQALKLNPRPPTSDAIVAGMAFLLNDQPDRAIAVLEQARAEAPNVDDVHAMLAAAYAEAGRADEARRAVDSALRYGTNVCTEVYRVILAHFREAADEARILAAMAAAGMPQWPSGFDTESLEHLRSAEIRPIVFGRLWRGRLEGGAAAIAQYEADGRMAFRTASLIATGRVFVDGDRLCERIEATMLGRPVCGPVLHRPAGSGEDGLDYTYVNATKVFHFAVGD
ncbi:MAG: tetratricopeptide repeat protein [Geminicoccaceae bacterium]